MAIFNSYVSLLEGKTWKKPWISQDRAVPLQTFERFDPELGRWEKLPRMPTARCHGRPIGAIDGADGDAMGDSWGTMGFFTGSSLLHFWDVEGYVAAMGFHDRDSDP